MCLFAEHVESAENGLYGSVVTAASLALPKPAGWLSRSQDIPAGMTLPGANAIPPNVTGRRIPGRTS